MANIDFSVAAKKIRRKFPNATDDQVLAAIQKAGKVAGNAPPKIAEKGMLEKVLRQTIGAPGTAAASAAGSALGYGNFGDLYGKGFGFGDIAQGEFPQASQAQMPYAIPTPVGMFTGTTTIPGQVDLAQSLALDLPIPAATMSKGVKKLAKFLAKGTSRSQVRLYENFLSEIINPEVVPTSRVFNPEVAPTRGSNYPTGGLGPTIPGQRIPQEILNPEGFMGSRVFNPEVAPRTQPFGQKIPVPEAFLGDVIPFEDAAKAIRAKFPNATNEQILEAGAKAGKRFRDLPKELMQARATTKAMGKTKRTRATRKKS